MPDEPKPDAAAKPPQRSQAEITADIKAEREKLKASFDDLSTGVGEANEAATQRARDITAQVRKAAPVAIGVVAVLGVSMLMLRRRRRRRRAAQA